MKTNERNFQMKISSVDFVVTPLTLTLKAAETSQYFLQFDKGAQILKKFQQQVEVGPQAPTFQFRSGEQGRFKLQTERSCNCEWGIYRVTSNEMNEFVDSLPVTLHEHYTAFANSLRALQNDYLRVLAERAQGKEIGRLWEAIKERCQWEFPGLVAKNRSGNIELRFRLEIRCEADGWSQAEKKKSARSIKSVRSLGERQPYGGLPKQAHEEDDLLPKNSVIKPVQVTVIKPQTPRVHFSEEVKAQQDTPNRITEAPPQMEVEQSMYKKASSLSDIIECSIQCSSNFNDKQKRNELKQISGIPEQENELYSPYPSTLSNAKTQNFEEMGSKPHDDTLKRRSNTFGSAHNELPEADRQLGDNRRVSMPQRESNRDEQLGKEQLRDALETLPQSEVTHSEVHPPIDVKRSGRTKYVVVFFLCLIFIAFLAISSHLQPEGTPTIQAKKVAGKAKPKKVEQRKKPKKERNNE